MDSTGQNLLYSVPKTWVRVIGTSSPGGPTGAPRRGEEGEGRVCTGAWCGVELAQLL